MNDKCYTCAIVDAKLTREWNLNGGVFAICDMNWTMDRRNDLNRSVFGINDMNRVIQTITLCAEQEKYSNRLKDC